jgi:hypothetical protein
MGVDEVHSGKIGNGSIRSASGLLIALSHRRGKRRPARSARARIDQAPERQ